MFRSGSPRPLSKPRNTFALFSTPLSRAVRPLCSVRHLARCPSSSIDMSDTLRKWEGYVNEKPTRDVKTTCARLQKLYKENKKSTSLKDIYPSEENKPLEEYLPKVEQKVNTEEETNLPIRYPKLANDTGDFYAQYTHSNLSIMKKRPYESSENSNEGTDE